MNKRITFLLCAMLLCICSTMSWGQTWDLTPTMTATLDNDGVLTISTTADEEAMPDGDYVERHGFPWYDENIRLTIVSVVIEDGVTTISPNAFPINMYSMVFYSNLVSVSIGNSVTEIGAGAFRGCPLLPSITIPASVTHIGEFALPGGELKDVWVEWHTPLLITKSVFSAWGDDDLYGVTLHVPTGTKARYEAANVWKDFGRIVEYTLNDNEPVEPLKWNLTPTMTATLSDTGVLTISTTAAKEAMPAFADRGMGNYNTPWNYVRHAIISVVIEDKVSSIGQNAFANCQHLTSITIPNSVTMIADAAFANCTSLKSITIPNSVTTIRGGAFSYCTSLKSITIPNSVTTIESHVFYFCENLTSVTLPNSITKISGYTFMMCTNLSSISIPHSVTAIEEYAFAGCESLTSVALPNALTKIGECAFLECTSLPSVKIPNSVTAIEEGAFVTCITLTEVTVEWATPLSNLGEHCFGGVTSRATLRVPAGTKTKYQAAAVWKEFATIVEFDPTGIEQVETQTLKAYAQDGTLYVGGLAAGQEWRVYSITGTLIHAGAGSSPLSVCPLPAHGVYIVTDGKTTVKIVN